VRFQRAKYSIDSATEWGFFVCPEFVCLLVTPPSPGGNAFARLAGREENVCWINNRSLTIRNRGFVEAFRLHRCSASLFGWGLVKQYSAHVMRRVPLNYVWLIDFIQTRLAVWRWPQRRGTQLIIIGKANRRIKLMTIRGRGWALFWEWFTTKLFVCKSQGIEEIDPVRKRIGENILFALYRQKKLSHFIACSGNWRDTSPGSRSATIERKSVTCAASAGSLCAPRLKLPSWLRRKIGFGPMATGVFDCARRKALRILSPLPPRKTSAQAREIGERGL